MSDFEAQFAEFVRDIYKTREFIPLHWPVIAQKEKDYVQDTLDTGIVSSVGAYVERFEKHVEQFTGSPKAVATVNGTAALHAALYAAGIRAGDIVITQALTFVATCNALFHLGAQPAFVDVSRKTLGLCPRALQQYLEEVADVDDGRCIDRKSGRTIKAVLPMHTFGHPAELDEIAAVCAQWHITLIEDAAESLGSFYKGRHTGTVGRFAAISFNGNKIITTGGGGMILCKDVADGAHLKHITTTAKRPHLYEYYHDEPGFNYRLPNLNAALGCAQMEALPGFIENKRQLAEVYRSYFADTPYTFVSEPPDCKSNYWLNAIVCPNAEARTAFLEKCNALQVMTRPIWQLMHRLPMFENASRGDMSVSEWAEAHIVNIPSSVTGIER